MSPGSIDTVMLQSMGNGHPPQWAINGSLQNCRVGHPTAELTQPEEVAETVLFLASERASNITLQDLYVDRATLRT